MISLTVTGHAMPEQDRAEIARLRLTVEVVG
jgi:hypothetical protein